MIFTQIENDIINAMKNKRNVDRSFLRFLKSHIQKESIDKSNSIDDDMCISVIKRLIKQCKDAQSYVQKGSIDYNKISYEISIYMDYLPEILDENETKKVVDAIIIETQANSLKDMGKVMGGLKKTYNNTIDMSIASKLVKMALSEKTP